MNICNQALNLRIEFGRLLVPFANTPLEYAVKTFGLALSTALLILVSSISAYAEDACSESYRCIEDKAWQFGLAIGAGVRSNPLVDGDNIPLILIPDIAYYHSAFYFDNGELGWQAQANDNTSVELFLSINAERANFSLWHPANIFVPDLSLNAGATPPDTTNQPSQIEISIDDINNRKWAIDAGIRWQWHTDNQTVKLSLMQDASGVYKGNHAKFEYQYSVVIADWYITVAPSAHWYSDKLTNYYYGISEEDTEVREALYEAKGGIQIGVNVTATYQLNDNWFVLMRFGNKSLHGGMKQSPLVKDSTIRTAFAGLAYRF